jgi:hypothetical protein
MGDKRLTDIARALERSDPLLAFKWVCSQDTLPFGLQSSYLESVGLPFQNLNIGDGWYGGSTYSYFPGPHNIEATSISLYEDSKGSALAWVHMWKARIKNFNIGLYGLPTEYKRDLEVLLLDTNNDVVIQAKLLGIWPAATDNFTLNYTDNNRLVVTQNFSVDGQEIYWPKLNQRFPP